MKNQEITYYTTHGLLESTDLIKPVNQVISAYCIGAKNIYNSAYFILRQIMNSYTYRQITDDYGQHIELYILKLDLHQNEINILDLANQTIALLNTKKDNLVESKKIKIEAGIKLRASKNPDKVKNHTYYQPFNQTIDSKTYFQFMDNNLLANTLKLKEKQNGLYKDYTLLPTHVSDSAVALVTQDIKNYYAALKSYFKNPDSFTGKPQLPKYKSKNSRLAFSLDKGRFNKEGIIARVITQDNINDFTSIKDKTNINQLYLDNTKTKLVSKEDIETYNNFRFMPYIEKKIKELLTKETRNLNRLEKIHNKDNYQANLKIELAEIQFSPLKNTNRFNHTVKIEIIVKHSLKLPSKTALNKLLEINAKFISLSEKDKVKLVQNHIKGNKVNIAGVDLGKVNLTSMVFTNKNKGKIISGSQYYRDIKKIDSKIDKRKSVLNNDTIRTIQSNYQLAKDNYELSKFNLNSTIKLSTEYLDLIKDINDINIKNHTEINIEKELILSKLYHEQLKELIKPKLSIQEHALLKQYETNCREDKELIRLQAYKNNYIDNMVHKLSSQMINICLDNNIDYLVIGKNDLWKHEINNGKQNNRDMYNFPHSELISRIQYKALKYGLVVLLTEESYTSKTSFMNNNMLKTYDNSTNVKNSNKKIKPLKLNNGLPVLNKSTKIKEVPQVINVINPINIECNESVKTKTSQVKKAHGYGGKRITRNTYINSTMDKLSKGSVGKIKVHADINSGFNIIKKIFTTIVYNKDQHNFNYDILGYRSNKRYLYSLLLFS